MNIELIIEIALAIAAWNRGWKGWALVPVALGWGAALVAGLMIGTVATTTEELEGMSLMVVVLIDIVEFGALIAMIVKERKPKVTINPVVAPVASSYQPARFCTGCGQELHDNASFCRACGQMVGPTLDGDVPLAGQRLQPMT
jgi:hypothetical protein